MSDAVMVPREAVSQIKARLMSYLFGACQPNNGDVFGWFDDHADEALEFALRDALAASTPVGGWQDISTHDGSRGSVLVWCKERRNTYTAIWRDDWDTYGEPGWFHFAGLADRLREVPTHWQPLPPPPSVSIGSRPQEAVPTCALADIAAERQRQVEGEGWTTDHDDKYRSGQLANAAAVYAMTGSSSGRAAWDKGQAPSLIEQIWPWNWAWFKPTGNARRDLVKAGALIVAEIERLDRKQPADGCSSNEGAGVECHACEGSGKIVEAATTTGGEPAQRLSARLRRLRWVGSHPPSDGDGLMTPEQQTPASVLERLRSNTELLTGCDECVAKTSHGEVRHMIDGDQICLDVDAILLHVERLSAEREGLREALTAWATADRMDDEYRELCERAAAEGWDEKTRGSHLSGAWQPVAAARDRARSLRDAALTQRENAPVGDGYSEWVAKARQASDALLSARAALVSVLPAAPTPAKGGERETEGPGS